MRSHYVYPLTSLQAISAERLHHQVPMSPRLLLQFAILGQHAMPADSPRRGDLPLAEVSLAVLHKGLGG